MSTVAAKKPKNSEVNVQDPSQAAAVTAPPPVAAPPPVSPAGDLPPAQTAPTPPPEWHPTPKKGRAKGLRPKKAQIQNAAGAAKELEGSPTYAADFGSTAPDPKALGFTLSNAAAWRDEWTAAQRWLVYCQEQRATWENEALTQMNAFAPVFDYATSRNPAIATKYRATERFLGAPKAIAQRAVTTRKAKRAAANKAAKPATPAPPPPPATTPTAKNALN